MRFLMTPPVGRRHVLAVAATCLIGITGTAAYTAAQLTSLTISNYSVPLQGAATGAVTIDQASAATTVVTLTSSNPQVVGVQPSVPIQPNSLQSPPFVMTGASPGC